MPWRGQRLYDCDDHLSLRLTVLPGRMRLINSFHHRSIREQVSASSLSQPSVRMKSLPSDAHNGGCLKLWPVHGDLFKKLECLF